jgi:uncharacterized membrane protein YdjX (TVP38/TMEM64 family)
MNFVILKKTLYALWISVVLIFLVVVIVFPDLFTAENIYKVLSEYKNFVWGVYIFISFISGFFVLPSTPFVLAGILLFPQHPIAVLGISMFAILSSASIVYYFSDIIGVSKYLERKYPKRVATIKDKLNGPKSFFFVFFWALIPIFPTDLICYVSGIIKLNYWKLFFGVLLGEGIVNSLYVFGGVELIKQFLHNI